jgi:hypothetical protein
MANQLKMAMVETIVALRRRGWSQRRIARELGIDRETVARHLRLAEAGSKPANAPIGSESFTGAPKPANAPIGSESFTGAPEPANAPIGSAARGEPVPNEPAEPVDGPLDSAKVFHPVGIGEVAVEGEAPPGSAAAVPVDEPAVAMPSPAAPLAPLPTGAGRFRAC